MTERAPTAEEIAGRVVVTDAGAVRTLAIDNPAKRNALDDPTRGELLGALEAAVEEPGVRAIVLTGSAGTFCAGGELRSMPTTDQAAIGARLGQLHRIVRLVAVGPKPVVAAVEGFAFGSGLSLAAACDHVVAGRTARLCASFGRVGLVGDVGLGWTLPRRVGSGVARQLLLFGTEVEAPEAAALGLVDGVVEAGQALPRAAELAAGLAGLAPLAVAATKRLLERAGGDLAGYLAVELDEQRRLLGSGDFVEGRSAFFERRSPRFSGC